MDKPTVPTKTELEHQKLSLEIQELQRRWWARPAYVAALFPTLLAIATLVYGFINGYFQASFIKLENQKHDLQSEIVAFTETKNSLQQRNVELSEQNTELVSKNENLYKKAREARYRILAVAHDIGLSDAMHSNEPEEVHRIVTLSLKELLDAFEGFDAAN
jgi:hypothetical protein